MKHAPMPERIRRLNRPFTRREWVARRARRLVREVAGDVFDNPGDWLALGIAVGLFVALMLRKVGA